MSARNLISIAHALENVDPIAAYQLRHSVIAAINPEAQRFESNIEGMVGTLKSMRQELKKALDDIETAEEFAKFFQDGSIDDELSQFETMFDKASKVSTAILKVAGPKDFFKNLFKKKDKSPPDGMTPSYKMDDSTSDEFVEGKREWADPEHYIEQESRENEEFFSNAQDLIQQVKKARKSPNRTIVQNLLNKVNQTIKHGQNLLKGLYKHLEEPAAKVDSKEDSPVKPSGKKEVPNLEGTVDHYIDMLKEHSGNKQKTLSLLKELFRAVGPALEEEKVSFASSRRNMVASLLIRKAHARHDLRPALLPIIKLLTS